MKRPNDEELRNRFGWHRVDTQAASEHASIRGHYVELATLVRDMLPECRAASLALTELQASMMWANAAIEMTMPLWEDDEGPVSPI